MPRPDSMQKVSSRRFLKRSARMPPRRRYGSRRLYRFRFLRGTFFPFFRASDRPIAIACLRLLTFLPLRPLLSVPFFRFFIARLTSFDALLEYLRAILSLLVNARGRQNIAAQKRLTPAYGTWFLNPALAVSIGARCDQLATAR